MNAPSREEIDAKLETIEARMDGRVASIEAKIDGFVTVMTERAQAGNDRMARLDERMARLEAMFVSLKTTMFGTAVAVVIGIAALNATMLSSMVASFESGKNTASIQAELKRQTEEAAALLKRIQEQVPTPATPKK